MHKSEDDAVDELLQTYGETGGINYLDAAATLPSRLSIETACTDLMSLMFPGFRSEQVVSSEDLAEITRVRVRNLRARLKTEICRSLEKFRPTKRLKPKPTNFCPISSPSLPISVRFFRPNSSAHLEAD